MKITLIILLFFIVRNTFAHNTCDIQNGTAVHQDAWHDGVLCHGHVGDNGSSWWHYGTNGKVAGIWGTNEDVGDCETTDPPENTEQSQILNLPLPRNPSDGIASNAISIDSPEKHRTIANTESSATTQSKRRCSI